MPEWVIKFTKRMTDIMKKNGVFVWKTDLSKVVRTDPTGGKTEASREAENEH